MNLYKEYIPTSKPNIFIKLTISFNKDTYHWATSSTKAKGYQLIATPVEKADGFETFGAFTGFYKIIYPVERQSKKRLEKSIEMLEENKEEYLDFFRKRGFDIKVSSKRQKQL